MPKAALLLLLALSACTTTKGTFCSISEPIRLSPQAVDALTDAEARDVLAHNERGKALCGWRP